MLHTIATAYSVQSFKKYVFDCNKTSTAYCSAFGGESVF